MARLDWVMRGLACPHRSGVHRCFSLQRRHAQLPTTKLMAQSSAEGPRSPKTPGCITRHTLCRQTASGMTRFRSGAMSKAGCYSATASIVRASDRAADENGVARPRTIARHRDARCDHTDAGGDGDEDAITLAGLDDLGVGGDGGHAGQAGGCGGT